MSISFSKRVRGRTGRAGYTAIAALGIAVATGSAGCGGMDAGPSTDNEIGTTTPAIGEPSCATIASDATYSHGILFTSPTTYNRAGCFKAAVVDVFDYGPQIGGGFTGATIVRWNAPLPTTQSACQALWLGSQLYLGSDGLWIKIDSRSANGVWSGGSCLKPSMFYSENVMPTDGAAFRITASGRTAQTGGAATRQIEIFSVIQPP